MVLCHLVYCFFFCSLRSCLTRFSISNSWACSEGGGGNCFKVSSKESSFVLAALLCCLSLGIINTLMKAVDKIGAPMNRAFVDPDQFWLRHTLQFSGLTNSKLLYHDYLATSEPFSTKTVVKCDLIGYCLYILNIASE